MFFSIETFAAEPNFSVYDGTAVILDINNSKRTTFNAIRADERLSPCSTFKILNSIISLETDAIHDENKTIRWDGKVREYPAWNMDHTMRSAITVSAVWFYQELARRVGAKNMQDSVSKARYGNADTVGVLTDFWLGSGSLKISANEQVDFLARLIKNELPFSTRSTSIVKDIIKIESTKEYVLSGKTGTCNETGWFVGFLEDGKTTKVFAFNIKGRGANGVEAKKIATRFLFNK